MTHTNYWLSTVTFAGFITVATAIPGTAQVSTCGMFRDAADATNNRGSAVTGMRGDASKAAIDSDAYDRKQDGKADFGEVNDVIPALDGKVDAVLVDVGGLWAWANGRLPAACKQSVLPPMMRQQIPG